MEQIILVVHLLIALAIIGLIMIQQGKGADAGASFGSGASQTVFGSDGSGNVLTRATSWLVFAFFATSFGLAIIAGQKSAPIDDLGLAIPAAMQAAESEADSDLPQVEDEFPAAAPVDDIPAVGEGTGDDVPELYEVVELVDTPS